MQLVTGSKLPATSRQLRFSCFPFTETTDRLALMPLSDR